MEDSSKVKVCSIEMCFLHGNSTKNRQINLCAGAFPPLPPLVHFHILITTARIFCEVKHWIYRILIIWLNSKYWRHGIKHTKWTAKHIITKYMLKADPCWLKYVCLHGWPDSTWVKICYLLFVFALCDAALPRWFAFVTTHKEWNIRNLNR